MEVQLFTAVIQGGSFALLAYFLIWGLPRLLDRFDVHVQARAAEHKAIVDQIVEQHRDDCREYAAAMAEQTKAIDRICEAVDKAQREFRCRADEGRRS